MKYLGCIFSDVGTIRHDVNLHAEEKAKSVYIKLANFIRHNPYAPITVKRKVLSSCMNAALLYGCETWGGTSIMKIETLFRKAIKITFGMSRRTPNEIVFLETGFQSLKADLYKRQYKFWEKFLLKLDNDSTSPVNLIFKMALDKNVHYLRHYRRLFEQFPNSQSCYNHYVAEFNESLKMNALEKSSAKPYSILNDYVALNSRFTSPDFYQKYALRERERQISTKYRSGSHYLKIVTGSFYRTPHEERKCQCGEIQTLHHVIFSCRITAIIRTNGFPTSLEAFFMDEHQAATKLMIIEKLLTLR